MQGPQSDPYRTIGPLSSLFDEPAIELAPGMVLGNKYELLEQIGRGGMGVVWKTYDRVGDRLVALKFVPRDLQRFESEMQRVRETFGKVHMLNHQSICPLYGLEDGGPQIGHYLVMKYLEGETLSEFITRVDHERKGLQLSKNLISLLSLVAQALDYAHHRGVIHRDIKPSNIFLVKTEKGVEVQIIDFGLADEIKPSLTRVSQSPALISGTRPYMAPEQWRGRRQTAATDQYALGVVVYELLAGELPFQGSDTEILRLAITQDLPETIHNISVAANTTIQKAMAKDAVDRFESCVAFVKALGITSIVMPKKQERKTLPNTDKDGNVNISDWADLPTIMLSIEKDKEYANTEDNKDLTLLGLASTSRRLQTPPVEIRTQKKAEGNISKKRDVIAESGVGCSVVGAMFCWFICTVITKNIASPLSVASLTIGFLVSYVIWRIVMD